MGWVFFAALYTICIMYYVAMDVASYGPPGSFTKWQWRWAYFGAPWLMLSDAWDKRASALQALKRRFEG